MRRITLIAFLAWAATVCCGCGDGMVDVSLRIMMDDKPVEGAAVSLTSFGDVRNRSATGMTDAEGRVTFTTLKPDDGVLPGSYKVTLSKAPNSAAEEFATYDPNKPEDLERMIARERSGNVAYTPTTLPRHYLSVDTTPLEINVNSDMDEVVLELEKSPQVKP